MPLHRRTLLTTLAAGGLGALAGCAHSNASLAMSPLSEVDIAERYARSLPADSPEHDLLASVVENGTATETDTSPTFDGGPPYAYDGAFYEVTVAERERLDGTRVTVEIDFAPTGGAGGVPLEEFPEPDRTLLSGFFPPGENRGEGPDMGASEVYSPEETEASRLVDGDVTAVRYEGEAYPITVETRPADRYRFRYEATQVAPDAATLETELRERYLFTLSGLTESERELVEEAISEGYYASSASETFTALVRRFREHEALDEDRSHYLVRHDGTEYWAELYAPFVDERA